MKKHYKIKMYSLIMTFALSVCTFSLHHYSFALEKNYLAEGIKLYRSGDYDDALNELRNAVDSNRHCPLAYYYAAKIRIEKEQFSRARQNLEAALRDSSDFHDANGLLAYILLKIGRQTEAITAWKEFVLAVGTIEEDTPLTVKSITLPEEYHNKLQLEKERKERERLEAEKKVQEKLEEEKQKRGLLSEEKIDTEENTDTELAFRNETIETAPPALSEQLITDDNVDDSTAEIDTPMEDLEKRIRSNIRTGMYGVIVTTIIIAICVLSVIILIRKRRAKKEELTFSDEVGRLLIDNEIELNEEKAIKEFEAKKREILQEIQSSDILTAPDVQPVIKESAAEEIQQPPQEFTIPDNKIIRLSG